MSEKKLTVLLIEDNPGDARLIQKNLQSAEIVFQSVDIGSSSIIEVEFIHEQRLSTGLDILKDREPDVILLDLGLPDSTGLDTLDTITKETEFIPIVVLTGLRDEQVGLEAIQHGAQDYLLKDEITSNLLARTIRHAIDRNRQEWEQEKRQQQLERLNKLSGISQEITHDIINTTTREELERAVCDHLVEADAYELTWIGEVDQANERIVPRVAAGVEPDSLDKIPIPDNADTADQKTTSDVIRTNQMEVVRNVQADQSFESRQKHTKEHDYLSVASIPIAYEGISYGVLNVRAMSPEAFSPSEQKILSRLGDIIGHAITAIERRDALVSDTVLELEFETEGTFAALTDLTTGGECSIAFENFIRSDDAVAVYGRAEGIASETFTEASEKTALIDETRTLASEKEEIEFELVTTGILSLTDAVAAHGGRIQRAWANDGELQFTIEFPLGRDKRQLVELVESHCPNVSNRAQRVVERSDQSIRSSQSVFQDKLTEKQQTALETAYYAGLFDWPRKSTEQDVAKQLGISPPTFNQHLRAAEQAFFESVFE